MRALTWFIALILFTLMMSQVSNAYEREPNTSSAGKMVSCRIITGYGTAIGFGSSKKIALENAREECGSKIIDDYIARRGKIPDEVVEDLTTVCVNLSCQ